VPFQHNIKLNGPKGEVVRLKSTFDDGAQVSAVDLKMFQNVKHCLDPFQKSNCILHMADRRLVPSMGVWNGRITIGEVSRTGAFEVFDSNGAWSVLFGKPLLKMFKVVHDYDSDIVKIPKGDDWTELENQYYSKKSTKPLLLMDLDPNMNQRINFQGDHCVPPSNKTALLPMFGQHLDPEKCINLKGDHCAPPSRQVSQQDNGINELVDEVVTKQAEQQPLTQEGNKRCTQEECSKWREPNGLGRKRS
jgi:hypothetical protein